MRSRIRQGSLLLPAAVLLAAGCVGQTAPGGPGTGGQTGSGAAGGSGGNGALNGATGGIAGPGTGGGPANGGAGVAGASGSGGGSTTACTALPSIPRRLWRLSSEQYSNATRDLLALTAPVSVQSSTDGMSAYALFSDTSLTVGDAILFSGFYQTAENILTQIAPRIASIANCGSDTPAACAMRFASEFGRKALRRPLEAAEVTNLMKVYTEGAKADFNTGISLMIEALVLSPSFLYRTELGPSTLVADGAGNFPDTTLTPYEVASQLGFLFLNSAPDDNLLAAAADGSLGTPAGISAQVTRLIALSTVKTNLTNVFVNWFSLGQLGDKNQKDPGLLASLPMADQDQNVLVGDLLTSAQQFINDTLWNGTGKVTDLVFSQKVFVNKRLATLYGLPFTGTSPTAFMPATWPATQQRIGLLTQPAFLWAISAPDKNSIVKRGQFIHDDVVCQDPLPPPIDLSTPEAMKVIAMGDSEITKSDARMTPGVVCSACHFQMDPYARVLQNFGPIGNYRTVDEANRPIDPKVTFSGASPLASPTPVKNSTEFAQALVSSKVLAACAVQKMSSYALGTMVRKYNTCEVQALRTQFDQSNGTIASLFTQIAQANFVRARAGGVK